MMGGSNIKKSQRPFGLKYEKRIKEMYSDFAPEQLSKHAYSSKPKSILSTSAKYLIPDRGWTLMMEPTEQIEDAPSRREGREIDAVSVGHRRLLAVTR